MIIQSLCNYYDILNEESKVPEKGYSTAKVSFAIEIDNEGRIKGIIDKRYGDKKLLPDQMIVPLQRSRSGKNPPSYFLCDNAKYVFGVEKIKKSEFEKDYKSGDKGPFTVLEESEKDVILIDDSTRARFIDFMKRHLSILKDVNDESAKAFVKFIENYDPEQFLEDPKIVQYKDQILDNANFVFSHNGSYIHANELVKRAWESYNNKSTKEKNCYLSQCLISGKKEPIARTHQLIKGVVNAQSAGASLVGSNDKSFNSYGKTQSYNAPVGESSMFKYTTALNYLLSESKHRLLIGDSTVVFWADAPEGSYEDFTQYFINPVEIRKDDSKDNDPEKRETNTELLNQMRDILNLVRKGYKISDANPDIDEKKMFYILGLSPNNARLSVRFWYMNEFGDFVKKVSQHYFDTEIERGDYDPVFASPKKLVNETIPKGLDKKQEKVLQILSGLLMRSILNSTPYPIQMYNAILGRVKVERSINSVRAGFIKAYLLRLARTGSPYLKEDMITVNLNETSQDVPYRLGRLFAVLEKAQTDTSKSIGSTINSKYFSSASTTPAVVFPVLIKLAQHHIAKSDFGVRTTRDIEEVLSGVDQFPPYLSLEEQGMFMLGYYHQRKENYKKKEEKVEAEAAKENES
ncbi:type I-C CRISPR-associated protein Cas8c/Csd1 [Methanolacinia paynteri]|uniref:type I-C CRISPR-associated protein Cas8c/Csd1 n=1 Tax=Methanolacinia paynteri TaxID=230356 RepID=UPI00064E8153|nr:type I-C CRISPR-associated protein Cas8c/Csd1 [Methanolacinia paynteri]